MSFSLSMAVIRKLFSFPFSRVILGHSLVLRTTRKLPWVRITKKTHIIALLSTGNRMNAIEITKPFKAQPTNTFFATVNQMFGGSSQLPTSAERAVIKSNR